MVAMRTFTDWHTWPDAAPGLAGLLPGDVVAKIAKAVDFATEHHGDQRRKTGVPYLEHLLEAVQILAEGAAAWYAEWEADFADLADDKPPAAKPS